MKKTAGILLLIFAVAGSGCATLETTALKRDPPRCEKEAKDILKRITKAWELGDIKEVARWDPHRLIKPCDPGTDRGATLDLKEEAVWIGDDTVMVRASWRRAPQEVSGSGATRHMAEFTLKAASPVTLVSIEGENPFERKNSL